jgi:hypothetical protein
MKLDEATVMQLKMLITPVGYRYFLDLGFSECDIDTLYEQNSKNLYLTGAIMLEALDSPDNLLQEFKVLDFSGKLPYSIGEWARTKAINLRSRGGNSSYDSSPSLTPWKIESEC